MRAPTAAMTASRGIASGVDGRRPAAAASCIAATRTMKNSSRMLAQIDRNRHALKQRSGRVLGLGEHAREEVQPAQLAVGVERGIAQVDRRRR